MCWDKQKLRPSYYNTHVCKQLRIHIHASSHRAPTGSKMDGYKDLGPQWLSPTIGWEGQEYYPPFVPRGVDIYNNQHLSRYVLLYPMQFLASIMLYTGNSISVWKHTMLSCWSFKTILHPHPNYPIEHVPACWGHHQIISSTKMRSTFNQPAG